MKKLLSIAAIVMIGALAFTSCKKSDSSSSTGSLSAKAGSTSISSNYCSAGLSNSNLVIDGANITSGTGSYPYVLLTVNNWNNTTGTYALDGTSGVAAYYATSTDQEFATSGTLTITSVSSTQISGTFSFTSVQVLNPNDSTVVTNGTFTAKGTGL